MAEIVINRCTLRLVRRHGWSWGPAPDRLLKAAVAALPLLLARKLGDLFDAESELEITEKLNVTVTVRLSELLELAAASASPQNDAVGPPISDAFEARLTAAAGSAVPDKGLHLLQPMGTTQPSVATIDSTLNAAESPEISNDGVLNLLGRWRRLGELEIHLGSFRQDELAAWFRALCTAVARLASLKGKPTPPRISEALRSFAGRTENSERTFSSVSLAQFHDVLEIAKHLATDAIDQALLEESVERAPDLSGLTVPQTNTSSRTESEPETQSESPDRLPAALPSTQKDHQAERRSKNRRISQTEFNLRSALPFLLLGPLSQAGYLDTLAATLEATELASDSPLFAAALAGKALSPPERGWRRDTEDLLVAGVFAGLESPPSGEALVEFARKISGRLTPLNSLLAYTLVKGHDPASPLALFQTRETDDSEILLVEPEGLFPIACGRDVQSLLPTLRYFRETFLLIQQASANVETLRDLDAQGFRFITDAPPTRAESWREVRLPSRDRLYTNDRTTKAATLARIAKPLGELSDEINMLWRALRIDRPAIPTARDSELELSLTMAATFALGTISWVLWRERETTTPLLALERFVNLPARVRFTSNAVQVRLPLGQRRQDLHEHGFLADVRDVPWLAGRRIEFLGG